MDKIQPVKYDSMVFIIILSFLLCILKVKIIESLKGFLMESKIYEALPQNSEVLSVLLS